MVLRVPSGLAAPENIIQDVDVSLTDPECFVTTPEVITLGQKGLAVVSIEMFTTVMRVRFQQ